MKKQSLNTLQLNKTAISKLENIKGGFDADTSALFSCDTMCEADCPSCQTACCQLAAM
ncbi:MAG: hypothetical protein AAF611_00735 [Bacteroidota bacterium]